MKKIIVDKSEGIAEVIDRILNEPDDQVSLVIPKGSALGRSVSNFHLLKREADSAGRSLVVESVDDTILAFAKESGIESSHPLWKGVRGTGGFSDIVSRHEESAAPVRLKKEAEEEESDDTAEEEEERPRKRTAKKAAVPAKKKIDEDEEEVTGEEGSDEELSFDEADEDERPDGGMRPSFFRKRFFDGAPAVEESDDRPSRFSGKALLIGIGIIVIAVLGVYAVSAFFDHADITINFKQTPWSYQGNFTASKSAVGVDPAGGTIPAQVFSVPKNITETFPGSLVTQVSQKAQGTITIYNAYSGAPQELVATTRFATPDGKIFRITKSVSVPGETKGANGALQPSSVTAPIVADQAGPDYNIGPVGKLTIPGFQKDAARYAGFYGTLTASTTGGFVGTRATPNAADIAAAKASTTAIIQGALQGSLVGMYPSNFRILDGAMQTKVTSLTVNTSTDANGNFSVFAEGTVQAIGFDESAFRNYLLTLAQTQEQDSVFRTSTLNYSNVSANFAAGTVSFTVAVQAQLEPQFSAAQFVSDIQGKSIGDARSTIAALPELQDGEISMWPSWLWSIPSNPAKVHVTVN